MQQLVAKLLEFFKIMFLCRQTHTQTHILTYRLSPMKWRLSKNKLKFNCAQVRICLKVWQFFFYMFTKWLATCLAKKRVPSLQFSNTKMTTKPRAKRNVVEQKYSNDCRPTILGVYNHFAPFCSSKFLLALGFVGIFVLQNSKQTRPFN